MFVRINETVREYHIAFEQDRSKKFKSGPNKGKRQIITRCYIWLTTGDKPAIKPILIGHGLTTQGKEDKADSVEACKHALSRALDDAKLGKEANTLFWKEFHKRHRRLGRVTFSNYDGFHGGFPNYRFSSKSIQKGKDAVSTPVHGYGGLHSHQRRALDKHMGQEQSDKARTSMYSNYGGFPDYLCDDRTGKVIRDFRGKTTRTKAEKEEQYHKMYNYGVQESQCHNITIVNDLSYADQLKEILHNRDEIKDIIEDGKKERAKGWWTEAELNDALGPYWQERDRLLGETKVKPHWLRRVWNRLSNKPR